MYITQFRLFKNFSSTPRTNSCSVGSFGPCRSCIKEKRVSKLMLDIVLSAVMAGRLRPPLSFCQV